MTDTAVIRRTTNSLENMTKLKDVTDRVNLVHQVLQKVMKDKTHYGTVPGCGKKMVLFKPGADLLAMTFRLVPKYEITRTDLDDAHREYTVTCNMTTPDGTLVAQGVGSASTMEKKYRYRGGEGVDTGTAVPKEYWDLKRSGKLAQAKEIIGGKGFSTQKTDDGEWHIFETTGEQQENPDIADCYNTVLKMAKKRAHIDATLSATGAADIFTQDIIDDGENAGTEPDREPIEEPQTKQHHPKAQEPGTSPAADHSGSPATPGHLAGDDEHMGILKDVDHIDYKKKTKDGKKENAVRYALVMDDGAKYGTFDEKMADLAMTLIDSKVIVTWVQNGDYKNATSVCPVID